MGVFVPGCRQADTKNQESDTTNVNKSIQEEEILNEVYNRFPSPEEMLSVINKQTTNYDKKILHKTEKVNNYLDSRSQALNLGVYAADLAFIALLEQHKDSYKYFEAIFKLSENLRISAAFDESLFKRTQENITNPDSLRSLTDDAFDNISNYLVSNDKEKTFAIISVGGFTEALYLTFQFSKGYSQENPIVQRIADQKLVLDNLVDYCSVFSDDDAVNSSMELLKPIRSVYSEISSKKLETKVTKAPDGKLIIKGGNKLMITEEQYNKLKDAITNLRNTIIQN